MKTRRCIVCHREIGMGPGGSGWAAHVGAEKDKYGVDIYVKLRAIDKRRAAEDIRLLHAKEIARRTRTKNLEEFT